MSTHKVYNIDTNIKNYTLSELMAIIDLQYVDPEEIVSKSNKLIKKYQQKDPKLSAFLTDLQSQLLFYAQGLEVPINDDTIGKINLHYDNNNNSNSNSDPNYNQNKKELKNFIKNQTEKNYKYDLNPGKPKYQVEGYRKYKKGDTLENIIESDQEEEEDEDSDQEEGFQNMNDAYNPSNNAQQQNWDQNQYLEQSDKNQTKKITNRQQTTSTFGNVHVPMKQQQIATTDTYNLPVKQDSLNPSLKNTINRFTNIDSQFRKYGTGLSSTASDFTLDLSDTLKDTLSIRLFSFQIPYTWYTIDRFYGNTCFWIIDENYNISINIPSGNYTWETFLDALSNSFIEAGFDLSGNSLAPAQYNISSGKLTLYLYGISYTDPETGYEFTVNTDTIILFYDFSFRLMCNNNCFNKNTYFLNNTLGWIMGFRMPYEAVLEDGNEAPAFLNLVGTKYLILVLDDYNQNHINNSLVSITQLNSTFKVSKSDTVGTFTYTCEPADSENTNSDLAQIIAETKMDSLANFKTTNALNGLIVGGKYSQSYSTTQQFTPSAPRLLTQTQIYTKNEIIKNKNKESTNYLSTAPTSGDILAILPIKIGGVQPGSLLVEFAGSIQENKRVYFGPVDIDRMRIKLLDDKGNNVNLNGSDWAFSIICECLYQY